MLVEALFTVWLRTDDVLPSQFALAPYTAVRLWLPTWSVLTTSVAVPELLSWLDPRIVAPSLKVTVPEGTELPDVTDAVSVTAWV